MNSTGTKSSILRVGIIGYGKIGKIRHECIKKHPSLELIGICDLHSGVCQDAGVPFYPNYRELLNASPDVVFVCTYNCYIPEITVEAIRRGIHVFTEKPAGRGVEDVIRIRDAAEKNGCVKVKFGFNHRYHEGIIEAKAIVKKGRFGNIMWIRGVYGKAGGHEYYSNWRSNKVLSGGGILIDQGIHMLDLFRYFCGEFNEVKSFVSRSYWPVEVEDNVFAILRNSETGQMSMIHSSATQWQHKFLLEIYMEKGYLEVNGILSSTRTYGRETLKIARCVYDENGYPMPNPQEALTYYDEDNSWYAEVNDFVECILEDKSVTNGNINDALKTMELVHRIYEGDRITDTIKTRFCNEAIER